MVATTSSTIGYCEPPDTSTLELAQVARNDAGIIVIGAGPVGMRFTHDLLARKPQLAVHLFGDEACKPYNRIQLSALLAGEINRDDIDLPLPALGNHPNFQFTSAAIVEIDRERKTVTDASGTRFHYHKLVLATGARAHIPNIPGIERQGVFSFRSLKDTESLYARILRSRHIVVVGGGLLGLEAAKGLLKFNTSVTVVQQSSRLMNRQLDEQAAALLEAEVRALGIDVITHSGVRSVEGFEHVTGVITRDGETIHCDTVLFCTGITPNLELARKARIPVGTGILVNDQMRTSDPDIFAIGECCEHLGVTYGLVNPGYEQAAVTAEIIANEPQENLPCYLGSMAISHLKVVGTSVCSLGEISELPSRPFQKELQYFDKPSGAYRKLVLLRGKIIGAVAIGNWPESRRVQEAYQNARKIRFWHLLRFYLTGTLWGKGGDDIGNWPSGTIICQCNNISYGALSSAIANNCSTLPELQDRTRAGTVCGSCKPLLQQLLGVAGMERESGATTLTAGALLAIALVALLAFWPEAKVADSVQQQGWFEGIWNDKFWKQVTGFTLLALTAIGSLMSLRKRLSWRWMGKFSGWRLVHVLLGVLCCITLVLHSGFHLGSNLNQLLIVNFLAVLLMGAFTSGAIGLGHKLRTGAAQDARKSMQWVHIIVSWPLPVLLALHILTVYYY